MATVRATCPDCGDIEISSIEVKARVCVEDSAGSYSFVCPLCARATSKPAEGRVIQLLVGAGTPLTMWRRPAELNEAHHGPSFTIRDVESFHRLLDTDHWFSRLASMVKS